MMFFPYIHYICEILAICSAKHSWELVRLKLGLILLELEVWWCF